MHLSLPPRRLLLLSFLLSLILVSSVDSSDPCVYPCRHLSDLTGGDPPELHSDPARGETALFHASSDPPELHSDCALPCVFSPGDPSVGVPSGSDSSSGTASLELSERTVPSPRAKELSEECAVSLQALHPCLPYIAGPPNHPAPAPSMFCCDTFMESLSTAGPHCVCLLVRNPLILGYLIDTARLTALFPTCGPNTISDGVAYFHNACKVGAGPETNSSIPVLAPATASDIPPYSDVSSTAQRPTFRVVIFSVLLCTIMIFSFVLFRELMKKKIR